MNIDSDKTLLEVKSRLPASHKYHSVSPTSKQHTDGRREVNPESWELETPGKKDRNQFVSERGTAFENRQEIFGVQINNEQQEDLCQCKTETNIEPFLIHSWMSKPYETRFKEFRTNREEDSEEETAVLQNRRWIARKEKKWHIIIP